MMMISRRHMEIYAAFDAEPSSYSNFFNGIFFWFVSLIARSVLLAPLMDKVW
jgi:hypothetical protein